MYSCQVLLDKTVKAVSSIHPCKVPLDTGVKGVSSCTLSAKADNVVFNFGITTSGGLFGVTADGVLTAKSGTIGGLTLSENSISASNDLFSVNSDGYLTAESGAIGGFTIGSSALYNGINSMTASGTGVYLGTDGLNLGGKFRAASSGSVTITEGSINLGGGSFTVANDGTVAINKGRVNVRNNIGGTNYVSVVDANGVGCTDLPIDNEGHLDQNANGTLAGAGGLWHDDEANIGLYIINMPNGGILQIYNSGTNEFTISVGNSASIRLTPNGGNLVGNWKVNGNALN